MILTVTLNPAIDRVYFLDEFTMGNVYRTQRFTYTAGGKGLNVARVAHLVGCDTAAMGFAGGYSGEFIKSEIEKQGIRNLFTDIAGETRTCLNISDANGISGEILEPGPEITSEEKNRFIKEYYSIVEDYKIICVSGSLPQALNSDFYIELINIAREKGKKIIIDTSGNTLKDILSAKPFMVKPNKEEISALMNKEIDTDCHIKDALRYLSDKGVEVPLISLGKNGSAAMINKKYFRFIPPFVKAVNAVGSGDSSVAGIAAGLDMGYNITDAVKLGMAAGTANTQFEQTGMVTKELVDKFYSLIEVKEF